MTEAIVKNASEADLPSIAKCHRSAFPKSLSSAMGHEYVTHMLAWYLASDKTFLFFLEQDGECVGYCGGLLVDGKAPSGSASGMTQFSFSSAVKAILMRPWLFFHPEFLSKYKFIWKNLRARFQRERKSEPHTGTQSLQPPHVGLVVIGVDAKHHGKGFGSHLLRRFEGIALSKGFKYLMLTVLSNNDQAIRSYERNGWRISEVKGKSTTMEKFLN